MSIKSFKFSGEKTGKNILFFACIHGNETCGYHAIQKIIQKIKNQEIKIESGSVTFVPICNPKAFEQKKRFIDVNLNRIFNSKFYSNSYEGTVVKELTSFVDQCDVFVDIHSASQAIIPFLLQFQKNEDCYNLSKGIGFKDILMGKEIIPEGQSTTQHYAEKMKKVSCLLECGQHDDPQSVLNAEKAILNVLSTYNIISQDNKKQKCSEIYYYNLAGYISYDRKGQLIKKWKTFDFIPKGDVVGVFDDGEEIRSPDDFYLIMPCENPPIGEEWFFFANRNEK